MFHTEIMCHFIVMTKLKIKNLEVIYILNNTIIELIILIYKNNDIYILK